MAASLDAAGRIAADNWQTGNLLPILFSANRNDQRVALQAALQKHTKSSSKTEVDVVPENGCIASGMVGHVGREGGVPVPFQDFEIAQGRNFQKGPGKLAKSSAN
jgi:hypothetical protein